jgi:hypothetical protein
MNSDERPFFLLALALASITPICRALLRIADCGLRIADCLGGYLPGKKSVPARRDNPKSAMATAISHHDIDPPRRNVSLLPDSQVAHAGSPS